MEEQEKPKLKILTPEKGLKYNPNKVDIMEFEVLYEDASLHRAMCQMASDMGTTVSALWNTIQAHALERAGYWSPAAPKEKPCKVYVTVQDLQDNPGAMKLGPNRVVQGHMLEAKDADPQDSGSLLDFLDDD